MARNIEAVAAIDNYLPTVAHRSLVPADEVQNMLLDLRLLMDDAPEFSCKGDAPCVLNTCSQCVPQPEPVS